MIREQELRFVMECVNTGDCASIVGLSNMGKSTVLRELSHPAVRKLFNCHEGWTFVYVDCNLMPERSEQAFHEIILRSLISTLRHKPAASTQDSAAHEKLIEQLAGLYQQVVQPTAPIRSPLAFDDAIRLMCEQPGHSLTLGFDEFDDPFEKLAGRTFLNLRAIKDKFGQSITYVAATERLLSDIRNDQEASEFIELFADRVQWVGLLSLADSRRVVTDAARNDADKLHEQEIDFIVEQAGGHAALLSAVTAIWRRIAGNSTTQDRKQVLSLMAQTLENDASVRTECAKIWAQLSPAEQAALAALFADETGRDDTHTAALAQLRTKRLVPLAAPQKNSSNGKKASAMQTADEPATSQHMGELLRAFVKRQASAHPNPQRGIRVDVDAGEVMIDGKAVEPLTELEYKLLLLLYGRLNKIVDKYTIVTHVWGENYLDSVDDARIEKLVSRLRSKVEPGADEPKYLITLRGRGYKLVS